PSDRCLQGYSSGGFFVLYALFQQPDAFQRYISGSAILNATYDYWFQHDAQLAARDASNPIQLYLSVGELESEIYAGEGHGAEGIALTYLHGIAMVYPQTEG
ncbi:MAG TPA: alpha/beta hydrolase-fold protein, partial [Kouleothrix sp.]|nr:alpha/beta hydrolase-fold protein [Kouleothrix sp.]